MSFRNAVQFIHVCIEVRVSRSILNVYSFFFQAEDGIRDAQESRGLGDVYKRQVWQYAEGLRGYLEEVLSRESTGDTVLVFEGEQYTCLLYTSDAADDLLCVDLGGRRIIKKKKTQSHTVLNNHCEFKHDTHTTVNTSTELEHIHTTTTD